MPEHLASLTALTPQSGGSMSGSLVTIDPTKQRQKITGFGAALTDVVASTISILSQSQQTEIYNALFAPPMNGNMGGSGYTMTRTHVGSCDFSLSAYTYDDLPAGQTDATLTHFSVQNDMDYLIPGLKAANAAAGGNLKILSSVWSGPAWMKNTNDGAVGNMPTLYGGDLIASNYPVFAQYLSKYVQAYKAAGLNIWAMTPQTEPLVTGGPRESTTWNDSNMNTFIRDDLGPRFAMDQVSTKIFIFDHNKDSQAPNPVSWATTIFGDKTTNPFAAGTAVHWYDSTYEVFESMLDQLHNIDTSKDVLYDEGTADGFIFNTSPATPAQVTAQINAAWASDDWFWNVDNWDWGFDYASVATHPEYAPITRYARDIIVGLNHWYTGWIDWVGVLNKWGAMDAKGGGMGNGGAGNMGPIGVRGDPGVSHIENGVPASIMVDEDPTKTNQTGTIHYTPIYYVMGHFSRFIQPGSTVLTTTYGQGMGDNTSTPNGQSFFATGALNPDGSTAVVLFNSSTSPVTYTVAVGSQSVSSSIPGQALQTLVWK
jgi:glucosylceramidase